MKRGAIATLVEVMTDVVIIWLPIDLLYLYFAGGWCEPNGCILGAEMVMLFSLPMFGMWRLYHYLRTKVKEGESVRKS